MPISDYKRQLFIKELSIARIDKHLSVLKKTMETINKDFDCLDKEDIYCFLEWVQRRDIEDWTKYTYKQIFKMFLKHMGKNDLANLIIIKNVKNKIPDIFTREEVLKMIDSATHPMDSHPDMEFRNHPGFRRGDTGASTTGSCHGSKVHKGAD